MKSLATFQVSAAQKLLLLLALFIIIGSAIQKECFRNETEPFKDAAIAHQWRRVPIHQLQIECALLFGGDRFSWLEVGASGNAKIGKIIKSNTNRFVATLEYSHIEHETMESNISAFFSLTRTKTSEVRDRDMLNGFRMAIQYLKQKESVRQFLAIFSTKDAAELKEVNYERTHCAIRSNRSGDGAAVIARVRWPPIFSQSKRFQERGIYVLTPDFTYFSDFKGNHNHGNPDYDIWFKNVNASEYLVSYADFLAKGNLAVWRGTVSRAWGALRSTIRDCHMNKVLDSVGTHLRRLEMCSRYKAIISIPGNGVWTWGTKFALLCPSVPLLMPPHVVGGVTWETRLELGLQPYVHYLPLSASTRSVCSEILNHTYWIKANPLNAYNIAIAGTKLIRERLSKKAVVRDLAALLKEFSDLGGGRALPSECNQISVL